MAEMKVNKGVLIALVVVLVLSGVFYKVAVSPKREEAGKLDQQVQELQSAVAQQRQAAAAAAQAKKSFPEDYHQLVLLGKAVPADDDSASMLVELTEIAEKAKVDFRDIELVSSGASGAAPPATTGLTIAPSTTDVPGAAGTPAAAVVPATEAAASVLPLGAAVGSAGLGVMPYKLEFAGSFFEVADFMAGLDELVETKNGRVAVDGRLMTIDGFALRRHGRTGFPDLEMSMTVTTYLTPPSQGLTAGATPAAPAPGVPATAPTTTPTATPAAATTETTP